MAGNWQGSLPRYPRVLGIGALAVWLILSSGCGLSNWVQNRFKVGPEYCEPPAAAVAPSWIESDNDRLSLSPPQRPEWWSGFNDPVLTLLIETGYEQNLTLREAAWRVNQAQAVRAITAGNLFPQTQQAFGEFDRIQNSENVAGALPFRTFNELSTGFTLSLGIRCMGTFSPTGHFSRCRSRSVRCRLRRNPAMSDRGSGDRVR